MGRFVVVFLGAHARDGGDFAIYVTSNVKDSEVLVPYGIVLNRKDTAMKIVDLLNEDDATLKLVDKSE
jgi:hypothetical protein